MNNSPAKVLATLHELIIEARDYRVAYTLAGRFCPEPWSKSLGEVGGCFLTVETRLQGIYSQLESLFDERAEVFPDHKEAV